MCVGEKRKVSRYPELGLAEAFVVIFPLLLVEKQQYDVKAS